MMKTLRARSVWLLGLLSGCSADNGGGSALPPGAGEFGDSCQKSEDCASTFCVDIGESSGVCSTRCSSSSDCPTIDNWDCVGTSTSHLKVCACKKTSQNEICGDGLDNDCDGKADDCRICDGIAVPNDDPANCGDCGNVCRSDQTCGDGKCTCPATKPDDCTLCTDTSQDLLHCGTCGNACGIGQSCVKGQCECPAGDASTFCAGVGCVDTETNTDNCGACGTACTLASVCQDGKCVCPTAGQTFCDNLGCLDLDTDANNCGACGNACSSDKICSGGKCTCAEGSLLCGDTCIDPKTDAANCGTCATACGTAQACVDGTCGCEDLGYTVCGTECANLQASANHCGTCGHACAAGERCSTGTCVCDSGLHCGDTCAPVNDPANCGACGTQCGISQICSGTACACQGTNLSACNGACVALQTDEANCGTCGNACPAAQSCVSGKCSCTYTTQTYCAESQSCVNLSSDSVNCGTCGNACKTGQYCSSGTCRCSTTGQTYCDEAGACTSLLTNSSNCGSCGNVCRAGEVCSSGLCKCPTGQTFCEAAGKCVSLTSDAANCGSCGNACQATQICQSSACRCSLYSEKYCASANACIDIYYDEQNCGDCGKTCPTDTTCNYGTCGCTDATKTLCTDVCYDLKTDKNHCGTCTNACSGSMVCTSGKCSCPSPIVGTAVRLTSNAQNDAKPSAAWDGTHVGVAYAQALSTTSSYYEIRFALLNADGTLVSDTALTDYAKISTYYGATTGPQLIWNGSEYALSWIDYGLIGTSSSYGSQVRFLRLDGTGASKGESVVVGGATGTTSYTSSPTHHHLAWSDSYQGYAVVYGNSSSLAFRRIGADASSLETPNVVSEAWAYTSGRSLLVTAAADGTWGVLGGDYSSAKLGIYNADGSRTLSPVTLTTSADYYGRWPSAAYQGTTLITSWIGGSSRDIVVNRGAMANAPTSVVTGVSPAAFGNVNVAMNDAALALGWTERASSSASAYRYRVQRFSLPTALTSAPVALHAAVDVLSTYTITATDDVTLVASGTGGLVAIWSDSRWGTARELYAAPVDLQSCP